MSHWYEKYASDLEQDGPPTERTQLGSTHGAMTTKWDEATMGQSPSPLTKRPHVNPLQCDTRTTDVFRTFVTDGGIPRHKHEAQQSMQNFIGGNTQELQVHMRKMRDFLKQLEQQVKIAMRAPHNNGSDNNRVVYDQFMHHTSLEPGKFQSLLETQYGIVLTPDERDQLFERYGRKDLMTFDLEQFLQRMVRNEASVGSWGGAQKSDFEMHPGTSPFLAEKLPSNIHGRGGHVPVQNDMEDQDSSKLRFSVKPIRDFEGTLSNVRPSELGGTSLCPHITRRKNSQRVRRCIQKSHLGVKDKYNDSALVRGYADSWVPPCGEGSWSAVPTWEGSHDRVAHHQGRNEIPSPTLRPPPTGSAMSYNASCQQHSMLNAGSIAANDMEQYPGLGDTQRTDSSARDPTGLIASKLKLRALSDQKKKSSYTPIPSVRMPSGRVTNRRSKSCATNINLLTSREMTSAALSTRRSKQPKARYDTRNELFDLTRSTMRSTQRL